MVRKILLVLVFGFGLSGLALAGGHLENEKTPEKFLKYYFLFISWLRIFSFSY